MFSPFLLLIPFLTGINAANDWSKPCISGSCSYDLTTNGTASGTVTIWGAATAISDITTAADWEILGCDPTALSQSIRLVCKSADSKKCDHLYDANGAVGKIVRLPENCGKNAFARVSKAWVPADQSIPAGVKPRIVRRDGKAPQVKALALDTNFASVDQTKTGVVNIMIQGANVPGAKSATPLNVPPSRRHTRLSQRSLLGSVKDALKSVVSNSISAKKTVNLKPLDVKKTIPLINKSVSCGATTARLSATLDASAHAVASIGVAAAGTIIPPKLTDFGLVTGLTASVNGVLDINADVAGSIDSGKIQLVNVGVPGLDFPGILTIGPSFQVNAQLTGAFDVNLDMKVGIVFNVDNAQIAFPPGSSANPAGKAFSVGNTPLTLSASPSVKATGTVAAHLIPSLNLGISALGGKAEATVHMDLDTSASLKLSLEASANAATTLLTKTPAPAATGASAGAAVANAAAAAGQGGSGAGERGAGGSCRAQESERERQAGGDGQLRRVRRGGRGGRCERRRGRELLRPVQQEREQVAVQQGVRDIQEMFRLCEALGPRTRFRPRYRASRAVLPCGEGRRACCCGGWHC
ncbi:hypothetical protein MIND_01243900 [Mycena indigotica]|uniref:DUF7223 domain-containing protein n=1 Tax=Mycena indigotica TaxID=2126181 RepID=A0A8H6S3R3_9AGAR|nr:uncharacterized protein MIND_01243900 [Mycena indigotica]KAF7292168.1 hypothetical protein MIND_01243900 [Mycena indigotica]